jgi:cytochrome c peroxidase
MFLLFSIVKCQSSSIVVDYPFISGEDSVLSAEKIELGRMLFFDPLLSINETVSCGSCHLPEFAFTDRKIVSQGVYDRKTERNSSSVLNAASLKTIMYDAHLPTLEMQVIVPIQEHSEMDMNMLDLIKKLRSIPYYQAAAQRIFSRDFDPWVLTRSIAAFERSLVSMDSRFDRYYYLNQQQALTKQEKKGWKLFSESLNCMECHPPPFFTTFMAENNGLFNEKDQDKGRFRVSNDSVDLGKFKIPSLRNVELTYPYMHNGSMSSLTQVIAHYQKGGNNNLYQSVILRPFVLSSRQTLDLIAFLHTLTDTTYLQRFR